MCYRITNEASYLHDARIVAIDQARINGPDRLTGDCQ